MSRLIAIFRVLHGSFWLLPTLVAAGIALLAWLTMRIDANLSAREVDGLFPMLGLDGVRTVLSTIAGGMITMTSIVFSLTFVALTTLSNQLGPRILLFFMNDRPTQIVLGAFIGIFLYALIVLLNVGDDGFLPELSMVFAVALAVVAIALIIYFVHHIAHSMQADVVVARLAERLSAAVDRLEAAQASSDVRHPEQSVAPTADEKAGPAIRARNDGYIAWIDHTALAAAASEQDNLLALLVRPADFVTTGAPLARWVDGSYSIEDAVRGAFVIDATRSPQQQAHFEITALTEVALRALSPGINDPFTAVACIDRLSAGLADIARREIAGDLIHLRDGVPRLLERRREFREYLDAAFGPICGFARTDVLVSGALTTAYERLADAAERPSDLEALREAIEGLQIDVADHMPGQRDREDLTTRLDRLASRVKERPSS